MSYPRNANAPGGSEASGETKLLTTRGDYNAVCCECLMPFERRRWWHTRCRQCFAWHRAAVSIRAAARALRGAA